MITDLKKLWKQAFGDTDAFIDTFFCVAYSPDRCGFVTENGHLAAMLYWFDCDFQGRKLAYIYAVATDHAFQNRGLCRRLMEQTHTRLKQQGYCGAILVPADAPLFHMYEKMGYRICSYMSNLRCTAGTPVPLHPISAPEYAALRPKLLPENSVLQNEPALSLLEATGQLYAGDGFILTAALDDGVAYVRELLGNADKAGITAALGAHAGDFRIPGGDTPFAMYCPFDDCPAPDYFGLALD